MSAHHTSRLAWASRRAAAGACAAVLCTATACERPEAQPSSAASDAPTVEPVAESRTPPTLSPAEDPYCDVPNAATSWPARDARVGTLTPDSADGTYRITLTADPDPIAPHRLFTLGLEITGGDGSVLAEGATVSVDAYMPDHAHGMTVKPISTRTGPDAWQVEGMSFHMAGRWSVFVDITEGALTERALFTILLK